MHPAVPDIDLDEASTAVGLGPEARTLLDQVTDAVVAFDREWRVVYANQVALANAEDRLGPQARALCERALRQGAVAESVSRDSRLRAVPMSRGGVTLFIHRTVPSNPAPPDPTPSDAVLSEAQLQTLIELVPVGVIIAEAPSGRLVRGNAAVARIFGRPVFNVQRLDGYATAGGWFNADGAPLRNDEYPLVRAVSGLATAGKAYQVRRGDGSLGWVQAASAPIYDAAGQVAFGIVSITDFEPERQAQILLEQTVATRTAALQRSQARIRALFEHSPIDILVLQVSPAGQVAIEEGNAAFCRTTGLVKEAIAGQPVAAVLEPQTAEIIAADSQICVTRGGFECQHTLRFPVGERLVRSYYRALPDRDSGGHRVLLTQIDLTESRRIETALRQALRLEVVGQLTGGVSHDFNNLLTAILGSLELLSRRITDERQLRWIQVATSAAQRGATLTQQLLAYARKQFLAPTATDIPAAIAEMTELIRGSLGSRIALETDFSPSTWEAHADVAQLELALLNMVVNARTAMPQGGRLTLSTRNLAPGDPALPPELDAGSYVLLAVADDGDGMEPEVLARAMEPFFTTKGIGEGSGLGLSQAYGFARQLGGTLRLRSQPGMGTVAEIFLPRAGSGHDAPPERLLLVDDNDAVRSVAATLLREEGWLVDEAPDGQAALDFLAATPYAVLLADIGMPGMSGIELARMAATRHPDLRYLFVTGDPDPALAAGLPGPVLGKPYSVDGLLAAVTAAIRRPSPPGDGRGG
jgi:signal transduction histidine kinase